MELLVNKIDLINLIVRKKLKKFAAAECFAQCGVPCGFRINKI